MLKLGVTGGLACGKTSVCHFLEELGAFVLNADHIVYSLFEQADIQKQVVDLLGEGVVEKGKISRDAIAKQVFSNPQLLGQLEAILHPLVKQEIERLVAKVSEEGSHPLFVAEVPLLFEASFEPLFDATLAVTCAPVKAKERFSGTEEQWEARMKRQQTMEEKNLRADHQIANDGSLADLKTKTNQLYKQLLTHLIK